MKPLRCGAAIDTLAKHALFAYESSAKPTIWRRTQFSAPCDDDGFASELRIIPLLHGRLKRVHIDMNDFASGHLVNHLIPRPRRVRAFAYLSGVWFPKELRAKRNASTLGLVTQDGGVIH